MGFIDQDPEEEELTTEKGCFKCKRFRNCPYIRTEKDKGRDFSEILLFEDGVTEIRFGCSCSKYDAGTPKETVQFS